jgi:hypothetical protein
MQRTRHGMKHAEKAQPYTVYAGSMLTSAGGAEAN